MSPIFPQTQGLVSEQKTVIGQLLEGKSMYQEENGENKKRKA